VGIKCSILNVVCKIITKIRERKPLVLGIATVMSSEVPDGLNTDIIKERSNISRKEKYNSTQNTPTIIEGDVATDIEEVGNINHDRVIHIYSDKLFSKLKYQQIIFALPILYIKNMEMYNT